ncbi:MAG TPA: cytochrome P450 [Pseudonocardiaceae bacterium]|jgi:cytochrome P450|nr:cytochrome P450 [Pseudonocardiaceae bacterium]
MAAVEDVRPPLYPFANPTALEPPAEWAQLRDGCPVARVRMASGDETLLLTRYDDVRTLLMDPRFTRQLDAPGAASVSSNGDASAFSARRRADDEPEGTSASMIGPGHQRWRRLVGRSFTIKRVTALQPRIQEIAESLIDELVASGAPADLGAALGFPLPVFVICELLGVPAEDRHRFAHWSDTMLNLTRYSQPEIAASGQEFYAYMAKLVRGKLTDPGDDLLSALGLTVGDEAGMTEQELIVTGQGLLIAGHETTANMIGKMVAMLLSRRERWERLLADPSLVRSAVEEVLRFDANPGFGMPRFISEPVEIAGTTLPAGTTVVCSMAAANRDEHAFTGADDMDLARTPNPHVAFGAGPHSCVGQALARTELTTVLSTLLTRLPTLELAVEPDELRRREGLIVGGIEQVPVRW